MDTMTAPRGGKREGAGRPLSGPEPLDRQIKVMLTDSERTELNAQAKKQGAKAGKRVSASELAREDIRAGIKRRRGRK